MSINLKAKETLIQVGKYAGTYRYILSPMLYNRLTEAKVIQEAAVRSGITKGNINAAWQAIGDVIQAWATEGHSVAIPGLGTMRFGVKASSASSVEKVSYDLITARKVVFTPSVSIKNELKNLSVSISCYDRNGRLVKTVTSNNAEMGDYEVELLASPEEGGTFEGAGFYNEGDVAVLKAIATEGYQFLKWDDDVLEAERTITVSDDVSHVATFKKVATSGEGSGGSTGTPTVNQFTLTVLSANEEQGTVTGGGTFDEGTSATISATAKSGYVFEKWSDGNTAASRTITVTENLTLTASFKAEEQSGGEEPPFS